MQIPPKDESSRGSWPEFIELVQSGGNWERWLADLFEGAGMELTRELEDEFLMLGQDGIASELEYSWNAIQSGNY